MLLPAPFPAAAISLRFGATSKPYSATNPHKGTDYSNSALGVRAGAGILASGRGVVRRNGWEPGEQAPTQDRPNKWAGNAIDVDYVIAGQRVTGRYMHRPAMVVGPPVETVVDLGTWLGAIGDTGFVTGAHLHFEVWVNGARVSPSRYFDLTTSVAAASLAGGGSKPFEPEDEMNAEQEAILKEVARRQTVEPPIRSRVIRNTKSGDIVMLHPAGVALIGDPLIPDLASASGAGLLAGQSQNADGTFWINLGPDQFGWEVARHEQLLAAMDKRIRGLLGPTLSDEQVRDISRIAGEGAEAGARAAINGATIQANPS